MSAKPEETTAGAASAAPAESAAPDSAAAAPTSSAEPASITTATTNTNNTTAAAPAAAASDPAPEEPSNILPAEHWAQIQVPDNESDADSAFDDAASSTASLSASILEYRTVNGRTFHSEIGNAQSWNPNDSQHDESMDLLHHVSTLMLGGKIFKAELDQDIQKVLDVGCGTGIWAIDFADQFPSAEVIGVDISPQQPEWLPPNLKFEIDDVTQEWTYAPNSFDYIHCRWLVGAIPDWTALFKQVYQTLKPGAIFESQEASCMIQSDDGTVAPGSALDQWGRVFWEAGKKSGRTFKVVEDCIQRKAMEEAGFVDIKEYYYKTPVGGWASDPTMKEMGLYQQLAMHQDIEGFLVYMWTTVMGWTPEEIAIFAAHLRRELRSGGKHHAWYPQRIVIGRKPE